MVLAEILEAVTIPVVALDDLDRIDVALEHLDVVHRVFLTATGRWLLRCIL